MNQKENFILANGQDKTADIRSCCYNSGTKKYDVTFQSGKKYEYNYSSIEWVRDPVKVDPALVHIAHGDRELFHIQSIFAFRARSGDYWHICFEDGSGRTYEKRSLKIEVSCLGENKAGSRLDYLRQLAAINELKSDDGTVLLEKQYEKLTFVGQDTAMAVYLDPTGHCPDIRPKYTPIFPFGGNSSQFHAVSAALENQISVIQGPPGTGKTPTILNIIANLLATGKTVLVVSNNNSATENVLEKLSDPKNALGFLVAPLGKGENKAAFIQGQTGLYPKLSEWKQSPEEYPIVLSTTFSSRSSLKDATYDYLIMDEASQVDVATGALALSCAKNAVIVGDLKQLPNVVTDEMKRRSNAVFSSFDLPAGYSFSDNSFLKSVCSVVPNVPQTLLREHYRCHPKIIGFCNQKFYQNELVIMTEDHGEPDVLKVFLTNVGNHRRDHINQRQIDVTVQEVLPQLDGISPKEIGIVAPYRDQVSKIEKELGKSKIEVHTVHKFQGREKDTIVLTTVDDVATEFSDDPYLLNVAVSRAKKQLMLVVSGDEQPADSNIGDLISYIRYNNCEIVQSELYSVFDLLYSQYTDARISYLRKHKQVSEYDSENLMYGAICDLLDARSQLSLGVICHQPLNMLIRDPHRLNDDERRYAMNTATHLDFLIYHRISRKPVLAIEVDGFHFHKQGTAQYNRDRMKDHILQLYKIPAFRFSTNGSGEIEKIAQALDAYTQMK